MSEIYCFNYSKSYCFSVNLNWLYNEQKLKIWINNKDKKLYIFMYGGGLRDGKNLAIVRNMTF